MSNTSPKQLEANRLNGQKGGVKTEEGKAVSKYNAIKHGLLSKETLLQDEDEKSLAELGKRIRTDLKPETEMELLLVDRIIANTWRLRRAMKIESKFMSWQYKWRFRNEKQFNNGWEKETEFDEQAYGQLLNNDVIEKLIRYETAIERGIYKALHELQRLQSERNGGNPQTPIAVDVDVSGEQPNGFVS